MGLTNSVLLQLEPDWDSYVQNEWRSDLAKELDGLGGLGRPAIPRNSSFSKKLSWLENTLNKHGTELEQFFSPAYAADRGGVRDRARRAKIPIPTLLGLKKGNEEAAAWRRRVHASRRRVLLLVRCCVLLMRGKLRVASVQRLDDLDFAIYAALGGDLLRVAEEQQRYTALREAVEAATVELQDALQAATAPPPEALGPVAGVAGPHSRPLRTSSYSDSGALAGYPSQVVPQLTLPPSVSSPDRASARPGPAPQPALTPLQPQPPALPKPPPQLPSGSGGPRAGLVIHTTSGPGGGAAWQRDGALSPLPSPGGGRGSGRSYLPRSQLGGQAALHAGRGSPGGASDGSPSSDCPASPARRAAMSLFAAVPPPGSVAVYAPGEGPGVAPGPGLEAQEGPDGEATVTLDGSNSGVVEAELDGSPNAVSPCPPAQQPGVLPLGKKPSGLFFRARIRHAPGQPAAQAPAAAAPILPPALAPGGGGALKPAHRTSIYGMGAAPGSPMAAAAGPGGGPVPALRASSSGVVSWDAMLAPDPVRMPHRPTSTGILTQSPAAATALSSASPRASFSGSLITAAAAAAACGPPPPSLSGSAAGAGALPRISLTGISGAPPRPMQLKSESCRVMAIRREDGCDAPLRPPSASPSRSPSARLARRSASSLDGRAHTRLDGAGDFLPGPGPGPDPGGGGSVGPGMGAGVGRPYSPSVGFRSARCSEASSPVSISAGPLDAGPFGSGSGAGAAPPPYDAAGGGPQGSGAGRPRSGRRLSCGGGGGEGEGEDGSAGGGPWGREGAVVAGALLERCVSAGRPAHRLSMDGPGPGMAADRPLLRRAHSRGAGALHAYASPGRRLADKLSSSAAVASLSALGAQGGQGEPRQGLARFASMLRASAPTIPALASLSTASAPSSARSSLTGLVPTAPSSPAPRPPAGSPAHMGNTPSGGPASATPAAPSLQRSTSLLRAAAALQSAAAPAPTPTRFSSPGIPSPAPPPPDPSHPRIITVASFPPPQAPPAPTPANEDAAAAVARVEPLRQRLQSALESLQRCGQLLSVFLNRCNAAWAEGQAWTAPPLVSQPQLAAFARSDSGAVHRAELLRLLRSGAIAVHMRAGDDFLEPGLARPWGAGTGDGGGGGGVGEGEGGEAGVAGGGAGSVAAWLAGQEGAAAGAAPDLWTHDPWRMLETHRPGMVFSGARLEGLSLGCRQLAALVLALEGAAGRAAVGALPLVVVVGEAQQDEVVRQLWAHRFFGIPRSNVVVLVQPSHPGYAYDSVARTWRPGGAAASAPLGSGAGLLQLAARGGEAQCVGEDGVLGPLPGGGCALGWLAGRGAQWLLSRRARDLSLLTREGALDVNALAFGLYYRAERSPATNIILEAQPASNLLLSRALDSIVLARTGPAPPSDARTSAPAVKSPAASSTAHPRAGSISNTSSTSPTSPRKAAAARGGQAAAALHSPADPAPSAPAPPAPSPSAAQQVVELCHADCATPAMHAVLADCAAGGRVLAGLGRAMLHLPSVAALLSARPSVLRPKLGLAGELLAVRLEAADITSAPGAATLLLQARPDSPSLLVADDVEALLPLLQAQDNNPAFRQLVMSCRDLQEDTRSVAALSSASSPAGPGPHGLRLHPAAQRIVVFVVANAVSAAAVSMAACLARPGRDSVALASVVGGAAFRPAAEALLAKHAAALRGASAAHCTCEVVERGDAGLIEVMERYAAHTGASLVVMGSKALTQRAAPSYGAGPGSGHRAGAEHALSPSLIHIVGSVTLALLRRMPVSLLLVTRASPTASTSASAPSLPAPAADGLTIPMAIPATPTTPSYSRRRAVRMLAVLEGQAKGLVEYMAGKLVDPAGGDQLFLSYPRPRGAATRQAQAGARALLSRYLHAVAAQGVRPAATLPLDGPLEGAVAAVAAEQCVDVVGLPAGPRGGAVPPGVVALLRAVGCAVLWHRDAASGVARE